VTVGLAVLDIRARQNSAVVAYTTLFGAVRVGLVVGRREERQGAGRAVDREQRRVGPAADRVADRVVGWRAVGVGRHHGAHRGAVLRQAERRRGGDLRRVVVHVGQADRDVLGREQGAVGGLDLDRVAVRVGLVVGRREERQGAGRAVDREQRDRKSV